MIGKCQHEAINIVIIIMMIFINAIELGSVTPSTPSVVHDRCDPYLESTYLPRYLGTYYVYFYLSFSSGIMDKSQKGGGQWQIANRKSQIANRDRDRDR